MRAGPLTSHFRKDADLRTRVCQVKTVATAEGEAIGWESETAAVAKNVKEYGNKPCGQFADIAVELMTDSPQSRMHNNDLTICDQMVDFRGEPVFDVPS